MAHGNTLLPILEGRVIGDGGSIDLLIQQSNLGIDLSLGNQFVHQLGFRVLLLLFKNGLVAEGLFLALLSLGLWTSKLFLRRGLALSPIQEEFESFGQLALHFFVSGLKFGFCHETELRLLLAQLVFLRASLFGRKLSSLGFRGLSLLPDHLHLIHFGFVALLEEGGRHFAFLLLFLARLLSQLLLHYNFPFY